MQQDSDSESLLRFPAWCVDVDTPERITQILITEADPTKVPRDHKWHDRLLTRVEIEESGGPVASVGDMKALRDSSKGPLN